MDFRLRTLTALALAMTGLTPAQSHALRAMLESCCTYEKPPTVPLSCGVVSISVPPTCRGPQRTGGCAKQGGAGQFKDWGKNGMGRTPRPP